MNATYTIRNPGYGEVAKAVHEMAPAMRTVAMLVAAPLLGLAFVVVAPIGALLMAAWMVLKPAAPIVKRVILFVAAPFVGLVYLLTMPFVGLGMMVYWAVRGTHK